MDCEQTAFQTVCVVHCFLGSFYMSRLGGEGGNAFSCDVLSSARPPPNAATARTASSVPCSTQPFSTSRGSQTAHQRCDHGL